MDFDDFRSLKRQVDELGRPSRLLREHLRLSESTIAREFREARERATLASQFLTGIGGAERIRELSAGAEEWRRQEKLRELIGSSTSSLARAAQGYLASPTMHAATGYMDSLSLTRTHDFLDSDTMQSARGLIDSPAMTISREIAERANALAMPAALEQYRATASSLAERISLFEPTRMMRDTVMLEAFTRSAAMSDALALASRVDRGLIDAAAAFSDTTMPDLGSLAAHRAFLDSSGLWLLRFPRVRLLTAADKRRRFRARLQRNAEPPHVKRAKSLVHQYERVLRDIIDAAMAAHYGEEWCEERLPMCGCKTLLGRAAARGGDPLDHADYAHYRMIMSDPQHYAEVFSVAFDDPETLAQLIDKAGSLRARSHHAGEFTSEDLRDLRLAWRTIEAGLLALMEDFDVDWIR
ncbi:MAG TPA: hypothetical protein VGC35_05815 [Allosphingosinicella sp.]|jgi:hypothetical protein